MLAPWAATVPVLSVPPVRLRLPPTVRVVPAAIVVVARTSTALSVWLPVIVPPAKTSVEVPGSSVPAVYVQLFVVRIVPTRLSVPDGLLMTSGGRLPPAVVAAPVNVWPPLPLIRMVAVPPVELKVWLRLPWTASVPVPLSAPEVSVVEPVTVSVVPAAPEVVARKSTSLRLWLPVTVPPAKTKVDVPASTVPAVYVQLFGVRIVPARVSVPEGLLMTRRGSCPAAVVAAPVNVWPAVPLTSSVPVPPSNAAAWLIAPWAASVPVPIEPSARVSRPATVSVSPPGMVWTVVLLKTTSARVWLPLMVWVPAKTRVEVPGSTAPAVYVQLWVVRIVPARLSVPEGLLMTSSGRLPAAVVAAPVKVWAPLPLMSRVAVPPVYVEAWLMAPWAARLPAPLSAPEVSVVDPVTVRVVPAATVFVPAARVRLLKVFAVVSVSVAAPPPKDTVPEALLRAPPVTVKLPETASVAVVALRLPAERLSGPLTVIAAVPPTNVPPVCVQPDAPTVTAFPAWVIVPV